MEGVPGPKCRKTASTLPPTIIRLTNGEELRWLEEDISSNKISLAGMLPFVRQSAPFQNLTDRVKFR